VNDDHSHRRHRATPGFAPVDESPVGVDRLLIDSATRLLGETATFERVQAAEEEGWSPAIWDPFAAAGFPWIGVEEEVGGSGGTLADAMAVLRLCGRFAAPIPAAETGVLGGWLMAACGLEIPGGPVAAAPAAQAIGLAVDGSRVSGRLDRVPWGRRLERVVTFVETGAGACVASVDPRHGSVVPATNLAGEPRDTITFEDAPADIEAPPTGVDADALLLRGALARAVMMAGALEAMSERTVRYTEERKQFGRPVGRFQAVQQHLVWGAQDASLVAVAADRATLVAHRGGDASWEIGVAKLLADECARTATAAAHQAHGAMGMTQEYPLHHLSRRLWAWRHEWGSEGYWSRRLGRTVAAGGADRLWPTITDGMASGAAVQ
jgi:acyl-CoA dehydrogenase